MQLVMFTIPKRMNDGAASIHPDGSPVNCAHNSGRSLDAPFARFFPALERARPDAV